MVRITLRKRHPRFIICTWKLTRSRLSPSQDIVVPEGYPFQPIKMKFITRVYHPNISSQSGAICLDILKDQWSPVLTLKSTLMSLRSLLCSPSQRPTRCRGGKHYLRDKDDFEKTARYWTEIYANGSESAQPPTKAQSKTGQTDDKADPILLAGLKREHVDQFVNMGFRERQGHRSAQEAQLQRCKVSLPLSLADRPPFWAKLAPACADTMPNFRLSVRNITDDTVLNELLK